MHFPNIFGLLEKSQYAIVLPKQTVLYCIYISKRSEVIWMVCMLIFSYFYTDKQSLIIFSIRDIFIKIPHNLQLEVCIYF